jgi:cytochrome c-type biogenesis protein CcmH
MSERVRNLAITAVIVVMAGTLVFLVGSNPTQVDRVEAIAERIKCPVCQGESIANSPSQMAQDMVSLVTERVAAGQSDESIVDELLASYTGAVLLDPPARGATLVLWLAPLLALATGAGIIVWWRTHHRDDGEVVATPSSGHRLIPLLLLGVAFAAIVVVAGIFIQDRSGPSSGVADLSGQDLDDVSNETMEAVIAANADHPQVDGMRLALAERYFEAGDYQRAFSHYLEVAGSANATDDQAVTALVRLGWMAWDGNAESEAAIGLFDQALQIDPTSTTARYLKGRVLWCGDGLESEAELLFEEVLAEPGLPDASRATVEADLEELRAGEACA